MNNVLNTLKAFNNNEHRFLFSAYLFSFSFSLTPFLNSLALVLFIVFSLPNFQKPPKTKIKKSDVFLLGFLFILYISYLSFTPSLDRAIKVTYRILPIIIIPVIVFFTNLNLKINYTSLKKHFIIGVVVSCLISLTIGSINAVQHSSFQYLFYFKLGNFLHIHPTYYALFILTALHFVFNIQNRLISKYKIWITILLVLFVFLLQSKIALIGLFLYTVYALVSFKKYRNRIIAFMILFGCLFFVGLSFEENRFNEFFKKREAIEIGTMKEDGVFQRTWLWNEAFRQIKTSPLIGYGLGSQRTIFKWNAHKYILKNEISQSHSRAVKIISELNLHNQFIQVLYELGFIGLSLYIISMVLLALTAIRRGNRNFLVIMSFFFIFMMTENLLDRQMGVYFYGFIISLLYFEKKMVDYDSK